MFKKVNPKINFPDLEKNILEFWEREKIFQKSVDKNPTEKSFIFYEGPPTANGKPGIHHVLARAFKDVTPRYKTMRGFKVERKAGWDTHGLPVELEVEKKLGISGKPDIEKIKKTKEESIMEFNAQCKASVWEYKNDWENMTKRMGFWIDLDNPYITYSNEYIESVWWILGEAWKKDLIYKGHKVLPYCPRCGTALSSHEVAQGYKDITEESVYIAFKLKRGNNEYILAWTTTPWTLPGNVALAVGENIDYVKVKLPDGDFLILGKDRIGVLKGNYEVVEEMKGRDLEGLEYEPLYEIKELKNRNSYKIILADFVTTEDGTGVVHTAVMYGEDDYEAGMKLGLPAVHTVGEDGKFLPIVPKFGGIFVKDAEEEIKKDLKERHLIYKTEKITHSYPFCWRCDSPLLYYAKNSWFIAMSKLREDLIKNNENINWVPEHIKEGRFGEWLVNIKDWTISRDRYWGTPLPIWQCQKCSEKLLISSIKELEEKSLNFNKIYKGDLNNEYIFVRHGETESNVKKFLSSSFDGKIRLTSKGKKQVEKLTKILKKEKIDIIFSSPLTRTKETAQILAGKKDVIYDDRLSEINFGIFDGKDEEEWEKYFGYKRENKFKKKIEEGENWVQLEKRMAGFFDELEKKYKGAVILIVSHGDPLLLAEKYLKKYNEQKTAETPLIEVGGMKKISGYQLDLHKPFIDNLEIKCKCGGVMKRTPEVLDCWFDSGAMPFAQFHYPYEYEKNLPYPADFISEAIDQTRGWFYTLHAISTMLGKGNSYKNVICLGHVLDSKGQKMSKSKGNVIDPMEIGEKHGFDAIRWYFYTNNQPGEPKLTSENDIKDQVRKFLLILWNMYGFFVTYANIKKFKAKSEKRKTEVQNLKLFDRWLISRRNQLVKKVTESLDKYDVFTAARSIEDFTVELSTWYLRRNKKREDEEFLQILYLTLIDLIKLTAPFAPFISEEIFKNLTGQEPALPAVRSVHLENWPEFDEKLIDDKVESQMEKTRHIIELGHFIRKEQKIRNRQPLSQLLITNYQLQKDFLDIIADELNIKNVTVGAFHETPNWVIKEENDIRTAINIEITPDLKQEGLKNDLVRLIQDSRKEAGYSFDNKVKCYYRTESEELKKIINKFKSDIKKQTILSSFEEGVGEKNDVEKEAKIGDDVFKIALSK